MRIDVSKKARECPMCGFHQIFLEPLDTGSELITFRIRCGNCGLSGFKKYTRNVKDAEDLIIDYWNTRWSI